MKRVLNSGSVKLTNVLGSEKYLLENTNRLSSYHNLSQDEIIKDLISKDYMLGSVLFFFEIKAPVLLLLQTFQSSDLGKLETFVTPDTSEGYIPPFFYKKTASIFSQMTEKESNDLHTKYSNFYQSVVNFYYKLLEKGVCSNQAQLILPQGLFTTFKWMVEAGDLIKFIEKNHDTSPEVYGYCETFMIYLKEQMPKVTEWLQKNQPII